MKVLFLIEGELRPAPRYRVMQFLPYYREAGIQCEVRSLHWVASPRYEKWPVLGNAIKALVRARRLFQLLDAGAYDLIYLQRMTLPISSLVERILCQINPRVIFDVDDPLFQTETGPSALRRRAFQAIVAHAKCVVAGSQYLADQIGMPEKTVVVPTVIDTDLYLPKPPAASHPESSGSSSGELVVGWMGTAPNLVNLELVLPVLDRLTAKFPQLRFEVISSQPPQWKRGYLRFKKWSEKTEVADLQGFDIGIMPLRDTSWNRGKCAFKLIQYMSVGIPAIGSAVGANLDVLKEGQNGFLAANEKAWEVALEALILNPELRRQQGESGRKLCVAQFSIASQCEKLIRTMGQTAAKEVRGT